MPRLQYAQLRYLSIILLAWLAVFSLLSHNLWTLLIDWMICVLAYRWLLYRAPAAPRSGNPVVWGDACR